MNNSEPRFAIFSILNISIGARGSFDSIASEKNRLIAIRQRSFVSSSFFSFIQYFPSSLEPGICFFHSVSLFLIFAIFFGFIVFLLVDSYEKMVMKFVKFL